MRQFREWSRGKCKQQLPYIDILKFHDIINMGALWYLKETFTLIIYFALTWEYDFPLFYLQSCLIYKHIKTVLSILPFF